MDLHNVFWVMDSIDLTHEMERRSALENKGNNNRLPKSLGKLLFLMKPVRDSELPNKYPGSPLDLSLGK
jgi:hypothetical protein